jgi:hypothetical protein
MTLVELQKQALNLSEAERRQLINTLMRSHQKNAPPLVVCKALVKF